MPLVVLPGDARRQDTSSLLLGEVGQRKHHLAARGRLAGSQLEHLAQDGRHARQKRAVRGQVRPVVQLQQQVRVCLELS